MEEKRVEVFKAASPARIVVSLDEDEEEKEKEERKGDDDAWAAPRSSGRRSQMDSIELHTQTSGINTAGPRAQSRNRVDSLQLQRSHEGHNTAETYIVPGPPPTTGEDYKSDEEKDSDDDVARTRYFGGRSRGGLSPRLLRVRQLNKNLGRKNLDSKQESKGEEREERRKKRVYRKSAPQISFA